MRLLLCVLLCSCGESVTPIHTINPGTFDLNAILTAQQIVYQQARAQYPNVDQDVQNYSYRFTFYRDDLVLRAEHCNQLDVLGCATPTTTVPGTISVFQDDQCQALQTYAHELIHYLGFAEGVLLGGGNEHLPPYFMLNAGSKRNTTWEYCARGTIALTLCTDNKQYRESDLEHCTTSNVW